MNGAALAASQTSNISGATTTAGEKSTERNSFVGCDLEIAEKNGNQSFLRNRRKSGFVNSEKWPGPTAHGPRTRGENEIHYPHLRGLQYLRRLRCRTGNTGLTSPACLSVLNPLASQLVSVEAGIRGPPGDCRLTAPTRRGLSLRPHRWLFPVGARRLIGVQFTGAFPRYRRVQGLHR
jgi:hypothetical protein